MFGIDRWMDVLFGIGFIGVCYGCGLIYLPLAFITGGIGLMLLAVIGARHLNRKA